MEWVIHVMLLAAPAAAALPPAEPKAAGETDLTCRCRGTIPAGVVPIGFEVPPGVREARKYCAERMDLDSLVLREEDKPREGFSDYVPWDRCSHPKGSAFFADRSREARAILKEHFASLKGAGPNDDRQSLLSTIVDFASLGAPNFVMGDLQSSSCFWPFIEGHYFRRLFHGPPGDDRGHPDGREARDLARKKAECVGRLLWFLRGLAAPESLAPGVEESLRALAETLWERSCAEIAGAHRCPRHPLPRSWSSGYGGGFYPNRYNAVLAPFYYEFVSRLRAILPAPTYERFARLLRLSDLPVFVGIPRTVPYGESESRKQAGADPKLRDDDGMDARDGFVPVGGLPIAAPQTGEAAQRACSSWWTSGNSQVKRSIFMEDFVFAVARDRIAVAHLESLDSPVATIELAR